MTSTSAATVVKVDRDTGKSVSYTLPIPSGIEVDRVLRLLMPSCNVGDFVVIGGEVYRRVRGGWRKATDDDLTELFASMLR